MAYEIKRFPHNGTIDADGHVLEPADLWEHYLPRKYKQRALRIKVDNEGYEYLEIDGRPSHRSRRGSLGLLWLWETKTNVRDQNVDTQTACHLVPVI